MVALKNIVLTLSYDGTAYKGWQDGKSLPTIENILQKALYNILNTSVFLQAASRTDAGVHAEAQVVNFFTESNLPLPGIKSCLNNILPKDIRILSIHEADLNFHPSLHANGKEYHYFVCNSKIQNPKNRLYSWHFPYKLNLNLMKEAGFFLTGRHDFEAFCNVRKNHVYESYTREVTSIEIIELPENRICFKIKGNSFLYKMVRNLVGTILYVGCGKLKINAIKNAIQTKDRKALGITAKAHGLTLYKVYFASITPQPIRGPELPAG